MAKKKPSTAWKPGQSGNPNGRPKKGNTFKDLFFAKMPESEVIDKIIEHIRDGNVQILKESLDRIYGRVKEVHQLEGSEQRPVRIIVNGK